MLLFTSLYVSDPNKDAVPAYYTDQIFFWDSAQTIIPYLTSPRALFSFFTEHQTYVKSGPLYFIICGEWHKLGDLFGGANIYSMKLLNVCAMSLSLVVLYNILRQYFPQASAKTFIFFYAMFSHSLFLSQPLLRDNFITLLIYCGTYVCLKPYSTKGTIILIAISFLLMGIRIENAIVMVVMMSAYCIALAKDESRTRIFFYIPISCIGLFIIAHYSLQIAGTTLQVYSERSASYMTDGSISKVGNALPFGVRQVVGLMLGILRPFPFLSGTDLSYDGPLYAVFLLPERIAVLFSLICISFLFMSKYFVRHLQRFSNKEKVLLAISTVGIIMSSVEYEPRRVMCLFPMIYLLSCKCYASVSDARRKVIVLSTLLLYLVPHVIYAILKA